MGTRSNTLEPVKRSNEAWIRDLTRHDSPEQHQAFDELSRLLLKTACGFLTSSGLESFAQDCTQEALEIIFRDLQHFRGDSRLTTWAIGIVLNKCREKLRKQKRETLIDFTLAYQGEALSLLEVLEDPKAPDLELSAARRQLVAVVGNIINQELTPRQRTVWVNVALLDQDTQAVAQQLGTNRNNVYKILHDARRKIKKELEGRGYARDDVGQLLG